MAYIASDGEAEYAVFYGRKGAVNNDVWDPVWSPDGKHIAGVAFRKKTQSAPVEGSTRPSKGEEKEAIVVHDWEKSKPYDSVKGFTFSFDSNHLIWVATVADKQCVVVDGKPRRQYDLIPHGGVPRFSDSSRIRYLAVSGHEILKVEDAL